MNDVFSDEILGDPEKAGCLATVGGMRIRLKADYKTNKSAFQGILEAALAPWGSEKEFDGRYGFEGTTDFGDGLFVMHGESESLIKIMGRQAQMLSSEDWARVINETKKADGKIAKLILTIVDIAKSLNPEEIKAKIDNREYTTPLRTSSLGGYFGSGSWSALLGTTKTMQLLIQGKPNGRTTFSLSYFSFNADEKSDGLLAALSRGELGEYVKGCLLSAICFKERPAKDVNHRSDIKDWDKWDAFLEGAGRIKKLSHAKSAPEIEKSKKWLMEEAARAIARLSLALNMEPIDVYKMLSDAGKERLNDGDIRSINAYRREHGLKTLTLDEAKEAKR